jgi:hypothetical protein
MRLSYWLTQRSRHVYEIMEQAPLHPLCLNIYQRRFDFHPQLSTFAFLFLLHLQIAETSTTGVDKARRDLLNADVNYTNLDEYAIQDNFLLAHLLC